MVVVKGREEKNEVLPNISLFTQKFYKIQIISGKIGMNWNKIGTNSEQSNLMHNTANY